MTCFVAMFLLAGISIDAQVLVLRSGKMIHGRILSEDSEVVRFEDDTGVAMTVKKTFVDLEATKQANQNAPVTAVVLPVPRSARPTTLAEVAKLNLATRTGNCRTFTNGDLGYGAGTSQARENAARVNYTAVSDNDLAGRLAKTQQSYDRLKAQCRAAGAGGTPVRHSATYMVGGKRVTVEGAWADPVAIGKAKQVCARALQLQSELAGLLDERDRRQIAIKNSEFASGR